jgi:hypothetical protein
VDPLLEIKTKPLGSGIPGSLRAYPEEVEVRIVRSPREVDVQTVRYDEISKVEIERGMAFAELKVKKRGKLLGGETLRVTGLSEQDAERAKAFIEERMARDS